MAACQVGKFCTVCGADWAAAGSPNPYTPPLYYTRMNALRDTWLDFVEMVKTVVLAIVVFGGALAFLLILACYAWWLVVLAITAAVFRVGTRR